MTEKFVLSEEESHLLQQALEGNRGPAQQRIAMTGLDWVLTLLKKNHDYGSTIFKPAILAPHIEAGAGILIRASDKVSRINQLTQNPALIPETLEDSLKDLGAYCLLYLCRDKS